MIKTGNSVKVYITDKKEGATKFTWLVGEQNSSQNFNAEMLDVSDKSTKWAKSLPGMLSSTIDVTVHADDEASGPQHELLKSLHKGQSVFVFVGVVNGTTPAEGDMSEAYVASIGNTYDNNGVASRAVSLQVTGEVVHYPEIE